MLPDYRFAPINKDSLYVFPLFQMGDNVVQNGMARRLAAHYPHISWLAKHDFFSDVSRMFSDIKNLTVVNGYNYLEARTFYRDRVSRQLPIGFCGYLDDAWAPTQFDEDIYRESGIPFDHRWKSFSLPPDLLPPRTGVRPTEILVHESPAREVLIDPSRLPPGAIGYVIPITPRPSFWDWLPEIYGAAEIHCVDSSYLNLVESLYAMGFLKDTKLVFHKYSKIRRYGLGAGAPILRAPWTILT